MQKGYRSLSNRDVTITDALFGHYVDLISKKVLPYQWAILNDRVPGATRSHCLDNFRIAGGELEGEFYGVVFLDTDAYKWIEAVGYSIESGHGDGLSELADELISLIAGAQQADGYINTYYTIARPGERWTNLVEGHELYCAGHLIEAAVAYFNATAKRELLDVAIRFADLIAETFGPREGQLHGYPGHQEIELALVRLFRLTNEKRYLDVARYFIEQRGTSPSYFQCEIEARGHRSIFPEFEKFNLEYAQAHIPPLEQRDVGGHAVRAMYMCAAMADLALETGDEQFREACLALWESTTTKRMFITGGIGSSGYLERFTTDYDLPNGRAYCETCASVGLMRFGQRMASLTHDASYYEVVERVLHNTVMAGINAGGDRYFYVNPLEVWPANCLPFTSMAHVKPVRQQWFDVACCPTNIARTLASLSQYIYAEYDGRLCIHQFISSRVTTEIGGAAVVLEMEADVLDSGLVRIHSDSSIALRVRVPQYACDPAFTVNGKLVDPELDKGYAFISLEGDATLVIDLHVAPRWVSSNDMVRENAGKAALTFGPFVYCLEETDNGANLSSIAISPETTAVPRRGLSELPGAVPRLEYEGYRTSTGVDGLYGVAVYGTKSVHLTAVPYCLWGNRQTGEMLVWQRVRI